MNEIEEFELKDVGLTHPDNDAFIKIDASGRIYIMSQPNLGIVIDPARQSMAFFGDRIKMITNHDEGFKWNDLNFNPQATNFAEPTFLYSKDTTNFIYDDIDRFLD
jgi:hypothetical protein